MPFLTTRTLDEVPLRVQQLRMRLTRYHFKEVNHVPRKDYALQMHYQECKRITRILRRLFQKKKRTSMLIAYWTLDVKLMEIKEARDEDLVCKQINIYCMEGCQDKFHLHYATKPSRAVRGELGELSIVHEVLLKES